MEHFCSLPGYISKTTWDLFQNKKHTKVYESLSFRINLKFSIHLLILLEFSECLVNKFPYKHIRIQSAGKSSTYECEEKLRRIQEYLKLTNLKRNRYDNCFEKMNS